MANWLMMGMGCLGVALAACAGESGTSGKRRNNETLADGGAAGNGAEFCTPGVFCQNDVQITRTCNGNKASESTLICASTGRTCFADVGCGLCKPQTGKCEGEAAMICRADGSGYDMAQMCDASIGDMCFPGTGRCVNLCKEAEASNSYMGCEYWPTPVLNSQLDIEFEFAVVVANAQPTPVEIVITLGAAEQKRVKIPAAGVQALTLPWILDQKGVPQEERSTLIKDGAYRLTSTLPVTVYQFNPLEYRLPHDCDAEHFADLPDEMNPGIDGACYSYSNDASLLLPTHVLTGDYIVVSRAAMLNRVQAMDLDVLSSSPGYFSVVGVEEKGVTVTLQVKSFVEASLDGMVAALAPGDTADFFLDRGAVLQVVSQAPTQCVGGTGDMLTDIRTGQIVRLQNYCMVGPEYDLTGSEVHADGKVAVFSGHNCSFIPYGRWACDHQEEALFPLQTWGKEYLVAATEPLRGEPNVVRILSGADGNQIHFEPAVTADVTLDRGAYLEIETTKDFRVTGTQAMLVAQFLVGQDYSGLENAMPMALGDPSLSLAVPTEQFRRSYSVLAPSTYILNFINVIAHDGDEVMLDGTPVTGFRAVPGTGMSTARVEVMGGRHDLSSMGYFGIVSYGFGTYTSYMYPGGLDLKPINTVE